MSSDWEPPSFAIGRRRLLARLDEGAQRVLTLVVGPSGSGKTVLLGQWAATQEPGLVSWLTVDESGFDAVTFARKLVASIAADHPGFGVESLRSLETGGVRMGLPFLSGLVAELAALPPVVLIIEDLHALDGVLMEEGAWLVGHLPPNVHIVASSRVQPRMPLARLRANDQLTEVLAPELAFQAPEVAEVTKRVIGAPLSPNQLRALQARTEGWVVGVQLAAVALRDSTDLEAELASFSGVHRDVADYLTEEVVVQQAPDLQTFLRHSAVFDTMDADFCNAVLGRTDGQRMLEELERRNLFVVALDGRRGTYRYHRLFSDLLRHRLQQDDPERYDQILLRASEWSLEHDNLRGAVEYLLRARQWTEVIDLVRMNLWPLIGGSEGASAIRWLESIPTADLRRHPQGLSTLLAVHRQLGNAATAAVLLAELDRKAEPGSRLELLLNAMRATGVVWDVAPADVLTAARAALDHCANPPPGVVPDPFEPPDEWTTLIVRLAGARALMHLKRFPEARAWLQMILDDDQGMVPYQIRSLGVLSRLEAMEGNLEVAQSCASQSLNLARQLGSADTTAVADAFLGLADVAYEQGDLDLADRMFTDAERQVRVNRRSVLIAVVVAGQARVLLARGRPRDGLVLLEKWRKEGEPLPPEDVARSLAAVEAQLLLAHGEPLRVRQVLARSSQGPETLVVAAQVAVDADDLATLALVLDRWPSSRHVRSRVQYLLWRAVLADLQDGGPLGPGDDASRWVLGALALARVEGHRQVLLDSGAAVIDVIQRVIDHTDPASDDAMLLLEVWNEMVQALPPSAGQAPNLLTDRERSVVIQLAGPFSNNEIAEILSISPNTLKTHLKRIYRKLDVSNRREAVKRAEQLGLIHAVRNAMH